MSQTRDKLILYVKNVVYWCCICHHSR